MKIKFFSIVSGKDKKYWAIKNNFQRHLQKIGLDAIHELIITDTKSGDFEEEGFIDTVYYKLDITRDYLKKGYHVLCSDLDIVFLKDPMSYLLSLINNYDIVFQHDYADQTHSASGGEFSEYCTGFYLVKPSKKTIQLFERKTGLFSNRKKIKLEVGNANDQRYINKKIAQKTFQSIKIKLLENELFPNGWYWQNYNKDIDPFIVHYNCILGIENKEKAMKKFNHWL